MKKGKYMNARSARRSGTKRLVALTLAMVLLIGGAVGGTLAWLTDKTDEVTNVFTTSDINITLIESGDDETVEPGQQRSFKMIPGWTIDKDPKATVLTGSEDCYLFVKVEENGVSFTRTGETTPSVYSFDQFLTYEIAAGWTKLEDGVYYKIFNSKDTSCENVMGTAYSVLKDDKVTVQTTVTKEMMDDLETYNVKPTLTFTAYAVQYWADNDTPFTAEQAWEKVTP